MKKEDSEEEREIHIGLKIREIFEASNQKIEWLAKEACYVKTSIYKIFKQKTINTEILERFCKVLEFNFFVYYYKRYKKFGEADENMEEEGKKKIHIGLKILEVFEASMKEIGWLANEMHFTKRNIYNIFKRETINTKTLERFCKVLEFNFFVYYYKRYKKFGKAEEIL
jgi:DNA-binding Xre family transcriptional regulator